MELKKLEPKNAREVIGNIEGATSLNNLVYDFNAIEREWFAIYMPIFNAIIDILEVTKMDKVKGAKFVHVLNALPLVFINECG